jgi:hypothetical protein
MTDLTKILNNPEDHYPGNFDTPKRANALLTGLCQDAAMEIAKLQYEVDAIPAIKEERDSLASEVLEQSRIIAMGAEREDALRAELTRLKASIALDKMAENARELGLDYEPAVQEGRDWSLLEATQESLREHMAEIKRLKAAQPVPVKTYSGGKPWPVAPKPWVGLTDEDIEQGHKESWVDKQAFEAAVWWAEKKLKEKNT